MLATLRKFTPATRERVYTIAVMLLVALSSFGVVATAAVPLFLGAIAAILALLLAAAQSSPGVRQAFYAVLAPVQALAQFYGYFSDEQWASIAGLTAAALGLTVAAAKAPTTTA